MADLKITYEDISHPPLHPACRCVIVPVLIPVEELMRRVGGEPIVFTPEPVVLPPEPMIEPVPVAPARVPAPVVTMDPIAEQLAKMTPNNIKALEYVQQCGELLPSDINYLAAEWKVTKEEVVALSKKFADVVGTDDLPLCVNRTMLNPDTAKGIMAQQGRMMNQFELKAHGMKATSGGTLDPFVGGNRDRWEKSLYNSVYQNDPAYKALDEYDSLTIDLAKERPVYGYLNDKNQSRLRGHYGDVTFRLKPEVKARCSFSTSNSSNANGSSSIGTITGNKNILKKMVKKAATHQYGVTGEKYAKDVVRGMLDPTRDFKEAVKGFSGFGYIETQIQSGVSIADDVLEIIITTFPGEDAKVKYKDVFKIAKKWNIPIRFSESGVNPW